jgi:hypothetical protein
VADDGGNGVASRPRRSRYRGRTPVAHTCDRPVRRGLRVPWPAR